MRVINTSVNTLSTRYLVIGFEGENERTQIRIDAASVFDEYPQASPSMAVKPGFGEEVYPVIVTKEGNEVVWDVTQDNLDFTGDGEIQLTFIKDNVICKTTIGKIRVNRSLIVNGDPPEHLDTWYEEATAKLADVDAAVYSLEALDATASGLPAGASPTVEVQDVNDHKRLAFGIPKGDRGDRGATGNGIRSISQSGSTGLYKKYTIHYTDGTTTTFQVRDGDRGLKGDTGATPDIGIGTVETLPAGSEATASMSGTAENPRLNLGIPKGDQGIQGEKGDKGDRGATPVFSMGAVTNLPAGSSATATITGTAEEPVLNLGIPKGDKGDKGDRGERGPQGIQGVQGDRGLTGPRGEQGQKGDKGDTGVTGATGATPDLSIGTVSTLPAGSSATAEITGTAENPVLSLGIPQGIQGVQGVQGEKGDPGDGVPVGGLKGQVLAKASDTDRATEWVNVAPVIKNTASGAIASFSDGAEMPVDEVTAQINPVQDLHGYDHPWPAGGGENLLPFENFFQEGWTITQDGITATYSKGYMRVTGTNTLNGWNNIIPYRDAWLNSRYEFGAGDYATPDHLTIAMSVDGRGDENNSGKISAGMSVSVRGFYIAVRALETVDWNIPMVFVRGSVIPTAYSPYSNICPISGFEGLTVTRTGKNLLNKAAGIPADIPRFIKFGVNQYSDIVPNKTIKLIAGTYTFSVSGANSTNYEAFAIFDESNTRVVISYYAKGITFTLTKTGFYYITVSVQTDVFTSWDNYDLMLELGSTATDYEPYSGTSLPISWQTEAGTVYGGSLTIAEDGSGVLTVDRAIYTFDGTEGFELLNNTEVETFTYFRLYSTSFTSVIPNWNLLNSAIMSCYPVQNQLSYWYSGGVGKNSVAWTVKNNAGLCIRDDRYSSASDFNASLAGQTITYIIATPITYTLTASEIRTLLGTNNIWADTGDVSVKYKADTKLYIDGKIAELVAQIVNS